MMEIFLSCLNSQKIIYASYELLYIKNFPRQKIAFASETLHKQWNGRNRNRCEFSDFSRARVRICPLNFRFSGQSPSFRQSHEVPLVKSTLVDNTGPKWRFNPRSIQSQKPRNPRCAAPISSRVLSENHEIPWNPSLFLLPPPTSFCVDRTGDYFASAHSRDPRDNGPSKYLFFGSALQGDRLISLKATMNRTERRVLTSELRGPDVVSLVLDRFLPTGPSWPCFSGGERSNFLICLGCGSPMIFQTSKITIGNLRTI